MNIVQPVILIFIAVVLFLLRRQIAMRIEAERPTRYLAYEQCSPWLFTLNGCGFDLYEAGREDCSTPIPSNSYYLFLCLFFVPVLPIKCYRAADVGENQYYIYGHESWRVWEVAYIYTTYYRWVIGVVGIIWLMVQLF